MKIRRVDLQRGGFSKSIFEYIRSIKQDEVPADVAGVTVFVHTFLLVAVKICQVPIFSTHFWQGLLTPLPDLDFFISQAV